MELADDVSAERGRGRVPGAIMQLEKLFDDTS